MSPVTGPHKQPPWWLSLRGFALYHDIYAHIEHAVGIRYAGRTSVSDALDRGRVSFSRQEWAAAYAELSRADGEAPLLPADLELLAKAAQLTGRDAACEELWTRAHHEFRRRGETSRAARCAIWLGLVLTDRNEAARGGGWIARARRMLATSADCVEQGYLLLPEALQYFAKGDYPGAYFAFERAAQIGERFSDADLVTLARHGEGRALIREGKNAEGMALLDETMITVTSGEVSPVVAGDVYCGVLSACQETFDLRRAHEWTAALSQWCAAQPELVPYRGQCLVRRAEILQLHGSWSAAMDEARQACARLSEPVGQSAAGAAFYQTAELFRLRGEFAKAEEAYRVASRAGRKPQPGLARLRLAKGEVSAAAAAIRQALDEAHERRTRTGLLAAVVDIMLSANDLPAARAAADELSDIADAFGAPFVHAMAAQAMGAVLLAERRAQAAISTLEQAAKLWRELEAPYEGARVGVLLSQAAAVLGDHDTEELELDAARSTFESLGAVPDLTRLSEHLHRDVATRPLGGVTARELQVLRQVATGKTNREIAEALSISEKTVARHLSNIFTKLDLPSRAAATAYAYQHHLI